MLRPKEDITDALYIRALSIVSRAVLHNGQRELNLAGIGESTMHPYFTDYVAMARTSLGDDVKLVLATNGVAVTEEMVKDIAKYNPAVWVSLHRPEKAAHAVELFKKYNILHGISVDPSIAAVDWAGQVNWHVSTSVKGQECSWLKDSMAMITAQGDITQCCFDGDNMKVLGNIRDMSTNDIFNIDTGAYDLCKNCHLQVPKFHSNVFAIGGT